MSKMGIVSSIAMICMTVVLFQNCGPGFEVISESQQLASNFSTPPADLPPLGTVNPVGAPVITKGLSDQLTFSKPEGLDVELTVEGPPDLRFDWVVGSQRFTTAVPRLKVNTLGKVDISVRVQDSAGRISSSRAIYSISRYAVIDGRLHYHNFSSYVEIQGADTSSLKLLGINTVADMNQVYSLASQTLTVLKVANALAAKELSPSYLTVNSSVYFNGVVIPQAQAKDFTVIDEGGYGKDLIRVYCRNAELVSADPASFELPFPKITFGRDKFNFYAGCKTLRNYSASSFSVVKMEAKDFVEKKGFFLEGGKLFIVDGTATGSSKLFELPFLPVPNVALKTTSLNDTEIVTDGVSFALHKNAALQEPEKFVLLKAAFRADVPSFSFLERGIYTDKSFVYVLKAAENVLEILPNAQSSLFVNLGSRLYKSGTNAYQIESDGTWSVVSGIDPATFIKVDGFVYKDSTKVYYTKKGTPQEIPGADPATIVAAGNSFYKDSNEAWLADDIGPALLPGVDGATFAVVGTINGATLVRDKAGAYAVKRNAGTGTLGFVAVSIANPLQLKRLSGFYVYTNDALYFINDSIAKVVPGIRPGSLKSFGAGIAVASDANLIYNGVLVPGVNALQLTQVGTSEYYKDANSVYHINTMIRLENADVNSFRIVNAAVSNYYSTDGVRVWAGSKLLPQADVATFRVTLSYQAEDKNFIYYDTVARQK